LGNLRLYQASDGCLINTFTLHQNGFIKTRIDDENFNLISTGNDSILRI